ncbi:MAG: hypothetical protein ACTSRZ_15110 [Promethearchaeota archaeon]
MKRNIDKNKEFVFNYNKQNIQAAVIASIVFIGSLVGFSIFKATKPTISTIYYHYNLQYRCGAEESYKDICFAVANIVWMYGNHTNWNYTIECQFMLLEQMNIYFPNVYEQMKEQNQRGQLELVVPQYSDAWHVPYPLKTFWDSVNYTRTRMIEAGFRPSKVIILQEGQWLPGFTQLGDMGGFECAVLHYEQATYFNYYPKKPILSWTFGGKTKYAYVNPRAPVFEAASFHHQIYAADGELLNTGDVEVHGGPASEFAFNPIKQKNHEDKLIALEKRGNRFMTMEQFFEYAVKVPRNIGTLDKFIPECEWVAALYDQYFTWMGKSSSSTDDGSLISKYYYTHQLIQVTELLLNDAFSKGYISEKNYSEWGPYRINKVDGLLLQAKKHLWEAQVSDTTGINPNYWEFWYGLNHSQSAIEICYSIIDKIRRETPGNPYKNSIQINPYTREIYNQTINFINKTIIATSSKSEIEQTFGFTLEINQKPEYNILGFNQSYQKANLSSKNYSFQVYQIDLEFFGYYNLSIPLNETYYVAENDLANYKNAGINSKNDVSIIFRDNWQYISYSPSLAENYTVELNRDDYFYKPFGADEWLLLLSMCNGLLYNPIKNYAIIKNCSVHHIPAIWRSDNVEFKEIELKYKNSWQFFIVNTSLENALMLANQINSYAPITLEAIN